MMKRFQNSTCSLYTSDELDRLLYALDETVYLQVGKHFTTLQTTIIRGVWAEQNYQDIAQSAQCSETHVKRVGAELWELLSTVLTEAVSKKTLRAVLERRSTELLQKATQSTWLSVSSTYSGELSLEYPDGPVRLTSPFYVDQPVIVTSCHQAIQQPGGLLQIRAPSKMGKTTLLNRVLYEAKQQGYLCVAIDLRLADRQILQNLDRFLRWLCVNITSGLHLPCQLNEQWNTAFGSKISCRDYLQNFLLPQLDAPLVLALDKLDLLYAYPGVADDFLALLRSWYEQARNCGLLQKLRLILVDSTKHYVPLNIYHSPLNIGVSIELPELSMAQVSMLAACHKLAWTDEQLEQLMRLVGGHPHLIRLALYHIARNQVSLDQLSRAGFTESSPFYSHLQQHLTLLEQNPNLIPILRSVLNNESVNPNSPGVLQLYQMGFVRLQQGRVQLRCELYRNWLSDRHAAQFFSTSSVWDTVALIEGRCFRERSPYLCINRPSHYRRNLPPAPAPPTSDSTG